MRVWIFIDYDFDIEPVVFSNKNTAVAYLEETRRMDNDPHNISYDLIGPFEVQEDGEE